jgi:hypothetical protein
MLRSSVKYPGKVDKPRTGTGKEQAIQTQTGTTSAISRTKAEYFMINIKISFGRAKSFS